MRLQRANGQSEQSAYHAARQFLADVKFDDLCLIELDHVDVHWLPMDER